MADVLTPEQRRRCMSKVCSKNTKPEMIVRQYLFAHGFRFRVNVKRLPGTPDVVLSKYKTVIFVNGCFWHGHEDCKYAHLPQTNADFWKAKIGQNKLRDLQKRLQLRSMGWHVILVWSCQLKAKNRELTLKSIERTLNKILLDSYSTKMQSYQDQESEKFIAAEKLLPYEKKR